MASKRTTTISAKEKDELLTELDSFLYEAYQDHKQNASDTIEKSKGQNADNESESTKQ